MRPYCREGEVKQHLGEDCDKGCREIRARQEKGWAFCNIRTQLLGFWEKGQGNDDNEQRKALCP